VPQIEAQHNVVAPVSRSTGLGQTLDHAPSVSAAEIDAVFDGHIPPFATRTDGSAPQEAFLQWLKTCGLEALAQSLPLFGAGGSRRRPPTNAPAKQIAR
jgi:hypothetical protein